MDTAERVQGKATKTTEGQAILHKEGLRDLGLLSPETRRPRGNLVTMLSHSQGGHKAGNFLLHGIPGKRQRVAGTSHSWSDFYAT